MVRMQTRRTAQTWTVGATVKVGFLQLVVKAHLLAAGDGLPAAYILANAIGTKLYRFVPHNGLDAISVGEAQRLVAESQARAGRDAANAVDKAAADAAASIAIDKLFPRGGAQ